MLLAIEIIQSSVIDLLIEKFPELSNQEEDEEVGQHCLNLTNKIVNQIRWMDYLVDASALTEKLLLCLPACGLHLQRDIILLLPEVVSDQDQEVGCFVSLEFHLRIS